MSRPFIEAPLILQLFKIFWGLTKPGYLRKYAKDEICIAIFAALRLLIKSLFVFENRFVQALFLARSGAGNCLQTRFLDCFRQGWGISSSLVIKLLLEVLVGNG